MAVPKRERDYFRRIARAKADSKAAAQEAHMRLSLDERLARSFELYLRYKDSVDQERDDDPSPFYERARALGLYRG